jgi:hemoglobin/transferrin/lactoferrin receptor protein
LKYYILKVDPKKNMLFNPEESIDFNGNTGPFIQYTHARIRSLFRKAEESELDLKDIGKMYDFKAGDVIVPNPDLKAEYAYNGEINITKVFGSSVKFDITGFYTYLDNAMVRREYTVNGQDSIIYNGEMSKVFALQNAADAFVYGINAGLEIKLPEGFGISGRYNYQFGEEEMEDGTTSRSRHSAPSFGYAKLTYNANRLDMQFSAVFNGKIDHKDMNIEEQQKTSIYAADKDGNPYVPSWTILNFKAMYRLTDMWTISAGLENITDRRYRTYSSGISAPGRNMVLSLIANF